MRWLYLAIVIVILAALAIFAAQNTSLANVAFLTWAISAPLALIVLVAYVLGAATGGSFYALLRRSVRGSRGGRRSGD